MDFKRDGIFKINNFLEQNIISSINNEVDKISDKIILNGNLKGAVHFNKNYLEVINPVCNIDSINLLELAVDVFLEFKKNQDSSDELKLTNLSQSLIYYNIIKYFVYNVLLKSWIIIFHTGL